MTHVLLAPMRLEALAARLGSRSTVIERIGVGPAKASATHRRLSARSPAHPAVLFGFAGALGETTRPGDLVVASEIVDLEGDHVATITHAQAVYECLFDAGLTVHLGRIVSSPKIVWSKDERVALGARGALAVDMESQWCAPLALTRSFAVVRSISDVPGHRLASKETLSNGTRAFGSLRRASRALSTTSPFAVADGLEVKVGDR